MSEVIQMQKSDKIKWFITILISLIILLIPCTEVYTIVMKKFFVITVFSLMCAAFEFFSEFGYWFNAPYRLYYF